MAKLLLVAVVAVAACSAGAPCPTPTSPAAPEAAPSSDTDSAPDDETPDEGGDSTLYSCHEASGTIQLAFAPDMELRDLVVWAMGFSCRTIVYDASLGCLEVTVVAPRKVTAAEAWDVFVGSVVAVGLNVGRQGDTVVISGEASCEAPSAAGTSAAPTTPVAKALDAGVTKIDDTSYEITRDAADVLLADPEAAILGARIVPSVKDGAANGMKLYAIRPSSAFAKLGLKNGDTVHSVNGHALLNVADAMGLPDDLREATAIELSITRRGNPVVITITVR